MNETVCSSDLEKALRPLIRFDVEEVWGLALNSRLEVIATELLFRGHASGCVIHAREIFRFAVRENAVGLVVSHSHPSGDAEPSEADLLITERLFQAGRLLGIPLIDHLVLSRKSMVSMAERGWLITWAKKRSYRL